MLPSHCSRPLRGCRCFVLRLRTWCVPARSCDLPLALSKGRRAVVLAWVKYPLRSTVIAVLARLPAPIFCSPFSFACWRACSCLSIYGTPPGCSTCLAGYVPRLLGRMDCTTGNQGIVPFESGFIGGGCSGGDSFRLNDLHFFDRLADCSLLYRTSYETLLADR